MLTDSIQMRLSRTNATALDWLASAQKQGAAAAGLTCPGHLPSDTVGGILVRGFGARPESARLGNLRDNQD